MNTRKENRIVHFMPHGIPRKIRIYDNGGKTIDRYTVIFTGHWSGKPKGYCSIGIAMDEKPFHPQGFCQHFEYQEEIDRPTYSHLGKRIKFEDLPEDCKKVVISDYMEIWLLN